MKIFIGYALRIILYYILRIFPIKNNKIFFRNYNGKGYGDNPKYIVEEIIKQGLNFELVWASAPEYNNSFPESIRPVHYKSIRSIFDEVTAKIWVDNCRKQPYVRKRKKQFYIQTWHGIGPKKSEKDVEQHLSSYYVKQAKRDSEMADIFLSDSLFASKLYRTSFWYNGEILECGFPRNDILINQDKKIINKVKKRLNIEDNAKIILYAPTFRNNFDSDVYNINYELILSEMYKMTKESYIFIIRLHPNITEKSNYIKYNSNIINASEYNDMQELLLCADILITDYSSCIYDFALMNKPVFLYISDFNDYLKERDLFFDLKTLPFPSAATTEELLHNITVFDKNLYLSALNSFFCELSLFKKDNASKAVVDRIISEISR